MGKAAAQYADHLILTSDNPRSEEPQKIIDEIAAGIPLGRIGEPRDIGELALFLASERSSFITGQTLIADGGVSRKLARTAK